MFLFRWALILAVGIVLSACGGQPTEDTDSSSTAPTVALSPVNPSIAANGTQTFTASGGTSPYTFAVISGGGTITAGGAYTAPATATTAVIGVADATGATAKTNVIVNGPVVISPTTLTIGVNGTRAFSATGGKTPYTFSKVSGVGAMTAAGVYTAGATTGAASVKVTDSLGQTATASITVNTALSISPATASVGQNGTLTFTAGGGVSPYTFAITGGGGSISTSGAFTAPSAPGTVTVRVTDSSGASSTATVTVVGPVAIAPASFTMAVDNTKAFTATGGSGTYTFTIAAGGGSINSSTGAYIAPATSGSATVMVTDSSGQSATAAVTINPALSISPASLTLASSGTRTFSATGGVSPYTFAIVTGGGTINAASGAFTAPATAGSVTVKVTDALANVATATVTVVNPLTIAPTTKTLAVNNTATFTAAGGQTPYTYSVQSGSGTVNASTGVYTAGSSSGSAVVRVTDSLGAHADAAVTINPQLTISPPTTTLALAGTKTFSAAGGVGPYTFSVTSGGGSINAGTGGYTAGSSAGSASVQVADALGNTATATVTVVDAAAISPVTSTVAASGTQMFSAGGGAAPYIFSIASGGGTIDASTGAFTAPSAAGTVSVKVVDSIGQAATATVTVASALTISPATVTLAVNNTRTFTATGGQAPYTFTVKSGGGVIGAASGVYTAPASAGNAVIELADAIGQQATANVTVNSGITISPATTTLAANGTATFSAAGGVSPYVFSITSGGGSINAGTGAFTAPASAGNVSVQVSDALGNTASALVTVSAPVTISPVSANIAVSNSVTFAAAGGQSPYTFSVQSGGGAIDASSGAYTAPAAAGNATVRVTDSLGQTADATVTVNSGISISPTSVTLAVSGTHAFSATGGVSPYTFAVTAGSGSVNASSGVYTAGTSAGSATVQVSDSLGNTSAATVTVVAPITLAPATATLAANGTQTFSAAGGQTPYTYSIVSGGGSIGSSTGAFTASASAGSVVVQAVDSIGQSATAAVTVVDGVIIVPGSFTLTVNNSKTFGASGGQPPYTYSLQSGGGSVNASTGAYTAPASAGNAVVVVTDSLGQTASANITVNPALSISPATLTLATSGTSTFTAAGGVTPYSFTITAGGGSIGAGSGAFTAPASAGNVSIRVSDALGNTASANVTVVAPVLIAPATVTLAAGNSTSFSASGGLGPYAYSVQTGGGNINPSTGAYTAAPSAGSAVVRVTDSLGQTADANVTVNAALSISPATATLAYSATANFTAADGVGPYTFAVKTGGGSVNASGAYAAGSSAGSAIVEVTDSLGNTASASVTVVAPVSIAPATATLAANGTQSFTAGGGQTPYAFSIVSGGGNINAATGAFTAPASAGSVSIKVVDAIGQSATANVAVVSAPAVSPATVTLAVNGTATFSATGGQAPYTYTVQAGGGNVDASGVYTAPASAGSAIVQVADALGQTATASVTVNPALSISPATTTLAQNGSVTFTATGGVSPYTFSVVNGGGSIGASSGTFTAPPSAGAVTVRVSDSLGNSANASVSVVAPVSISPANVTLAILNSTTFSASGGLGPYTFSVHSGGGAVGASTGFYTAGAAAGTAVVRVTDSLGQTADANVTVNGAISIAPASVTLAYNAAQSFAASGGVSPYSYSVASGGGAIGGSTGAYTSPTSAGTATVQVSDALGNTASASVTVVAPTAIAPATTTVTVNGTKSFTASGGQTPYTYAVLSGGGSINASGLYTAPASASTVVVQVTDAIGQTASANVTVVPVLTITPVTYSMAVSNSKTFAASGGQTPYTFSVQSGGGSINASTGAYTAPATAGNAVIAVSDASGQSATASVSVVSGLTISPTTLTLAVNNASTFSASGGITPYVFSIASGGGSINAGTGAFVAPASAGAVSVRVTDSIGNTSTATVTVNPALSITPASVTLASAGTQNFTASGGTGGNTFSIVSGGGTLNAASGAFTAPTGPATVSVKVTDSFGNTSTASVSVVAPLSLSPAATTLAVNNTATFSAAGGQTPYTYSLQSGGGSIASTTGVYTAPASSGSAVVLVTDALGSTASANVTINAALAISPTALALAVNGTQTFTASGGVTPHTFSIASGGGSIVSGTGAFTAPAATGTVTVRVTDSKGNMSNATVTVVNALAISPTSFTLAVGNTKTFAASGGQAPYTFSIQSGGGTINAASGLYTAPSAAGTAVVKVQDASGQSVTANVTINPALTISPVTATVGANSTKTFTGGGGVTPFTFSVASGGGSVNSSGVYTAPSAAGSATVRITDALGNTANATVTILNGVQISPATLTLAVNNTFTFTADGGQTPYAFSKVSGQGSINATSGVFTAGNNSGTTVVRVTDGLGQTSSATITVNPALTLLPATWTMTTGTTKAFSASGGSSPFTYSVLIGTGTIDATGVFTAPASAESNTIQVTDSMGNTASATVEVYLPLALSPSPGYVISGNVLSMSASGGDGVYGFEILSGVGSIDPTGGDYTAPATPGTAIIRVTDGTGSSVQATVTTYDQLNLTPNTITVGPGNTQTFTATGGFGALTLSLVSGGGSLDSSTGVYTAPGTAGSAVVQVTDSIGNTDTSNITITAALQISPTVSYMGPAENKTFTAANGVAPITFSIVSGGGTLNASTGAFVSPTSPDTVTVAATDALGNTSTATVTVVAPARLASGGSGNCVVFSDGAVRCWGQNNYGQSGTGNTTNYGSAANQMGINLPWVNLGVDRTAKMMVKGLSHTCAILDDDKVKCWGRNNNGQLGLGNTATVGTTTASMANLAYVNLGTGRTAKKIYAGHYHTCAILDNDSLKCWGYNAYGQLGQNNTTSYGSAANQMGDNLPPVYLGSGRTAKSVAMGYYHTCVLLDNNTVKCFGRSNYGQLGYGNSSSVGASSGQMATLAAVNVGTGRTVKAITAGIYHTCAIRDNNTTVCWGRNNQDQLGIASTANTWGAAANQMGDSLPLVNLGTGRVAVALSSHNNHSCAQLDNGALKCWGDNASGQLGIGNTNDMGGSNGTMGDNLPAVNAGTGISLSTVTTSSSNSCILTLDYRVKCWGSAGSGALGNGSTTTSYGTSSSTMGDNLPFVGL